MSAPTVIRGTAPSPRLQGHYRMMAGMWREMIKETGGYVLFFSRDVDADEAFRWSRELPDPASIKPGVVIEGDGKFYLAIGGDKFNGAKEIVETAP